MMRSRRQIREVLSIEFPRDTKGGAGHGNYIVIGGRDVADVRHAIEIALELTEKYAGEVYASTAGHLEFAYSASAGGALQKAFHAAPDEAFGFLTGAPAAIGLVMADTAMKTSAVKIACYMTPSLGTSHTNEVILGISGDASAVRSSVIAARQIGLELLASMGRFRSASGRHICKRLFRFLTKNEKKYNNCLENKNIALLFFHKEPFLNLSDDYAFFKIIWLL